MATTVPMAKNPIAYRATITGLKRSISPELYAQVSPIIKRCYEPVYCHLFYWQPEGHGPYSYFVAAASAEEAAVQINEWRKSQPDRDNYFVGDEDITPEELKSVEVGQVVVNNND